MGVQIQSLKEAGLTSKQIEIVREKFGASAMEAMTIPYAGRRITDEEIKQLKEAGLTDGQIKVVRELFEVPSLLEGLGIPALTKRRLTEAQIPYSNN